MVDSCLLIKLSCIGIVFAHYHSKFSAGIAEDGGSVHALDVFDYKGASGTGSIREGLVLGKAVCVPRHIELSEPGRKWANHLLCSSHAELQFWKLDQRYCFGTGKSYFGTP
jgi:hypothetical protein